MRSRWIYPKELKAEIGKGSLQGATKITESGLGRKSVKPDGASRLSYGPE